ncbi:hypothetical protein [Paraglaciecola hydrolytica]|uniref:Uncharacterized protein n=1 Tax=Paraglaciecola hydrolytica TaxID=1799789 RepID=A0A148KL63_9ALTE|nr:hypothetical protein [Paraglaciecola hydrolytica]KXI27037.1 hypothetical protein AX660_02085 [Paraglaciecola hydrolytica]
MDIISKNRDLLVGHIKKSANNEILGSCVPFSKGKDYFVITCGHTLYKPTNAKDPADKSYDLKCELKELKVTVDGIDYAFSRLMGEKEQTKISDLAIVKIDLNACNIPPPFLELKFLDIKNGEYLEKSRICILPINDSRSQSIKSLSFDKDISVYIFSVTVEKGTFHNYEFGTTGASEYKGVSGCGLFLDYNGQIYLLGILQKILDTSVTHGIDVLNPSALKSLMNDINVSDRLVKKFASMHYNSSLNSLNASAILRTQLSKNAVNKSNNVLICAPSDISSSQLSKDIFIKLISKLNTEGINYFVGGGKETLKIKNPYPHFNENDFLMSGKCSSLIIIADDHSTFSQFSLLSKSISSKEQFNVAMYVFYEDKVTDNQLFMKDGPYQFAKDILQASLLKFSEFKQSDIDETVRMITNRHLFLQGAV